jgi:hypothetical protein
MQARLDFQEFLFVLFVFSSKMEFEMSLCYEKKTQTKVEFE